MTQSKVQADSQSAACASQAYPLSPMQLGMLFHWLRDPQAGVDIEQISCSLRDVDVAAFTRAWDAVTDSCAVLRTSFRWQGVDEPLQCVAASVALDVHEEDWRSINRDDQIARFAAFIDADRRRGFDVAAFPLFRLAFFRTSDHTYEFVWTFPHILLDGRSFVHVVTDVIERYRALEEGREPVIPERRPYREFIDWLGRQDAERAKEFWARALDGFAEPVFPDLGAIHHEAAGPEYAERSVRLSRDDTVSLEAFVARHALTVNTMVQGAWALLLNRYTARDDVVFGATRASRRSALDGDRSVDEMIGLFINTLPVRVRMLPTQSVVSLLKQIREDQVAVRDAEHTLLTDVQSGTSVPAGTPLFETMLVYEHAQQATSFNAIDPRFFDFRLREKTTFPLTLHAYGEAELLLRIEYYRTRFDDDAITRMLGHVATLLTEMVSNGDLPIGDLTMLSTPERDTLLRAWNDTDATYPEEATIHGLIEAQVRQSPDAVAVEFIDQGVHESLTYRELDTRANRVANALVRAGVAPDDRVALCLERSVNTVVAILGVLKAGGAYLPIDPAYPDDRIEYTLQDGGAVVVLTDASQRQRLDGLSPGTTLMDVDDLVREGTDDVAPAVAVTSANLAYVIYTSGSTGRPKGVMIEHRNVTRLLINDRTLFDFDERDVWTVFHSFAFDFSVWELYGALMFGGRAVVVPRSVAQNPAEFLALLEATGTTVLNQVPSAFYGLMHEALARPNVRLSALRYVIFGGEALKPSLLREWKARWPSIRLINMFGITETTVHVTYKEITNAEITAGVSNIGRPIPTLTTYVLDQRLQPVPIGVIGELCVGGLGVARGYLNRPELSAERFVPDPFARGGRLYRSGDLGRLLPNGEIEYIGRRDHQVKLRGFRIEVGEIEAALEKIASVRECAVMLRTDPGIDPRLVAYIVPVNGMPSSAELRGQLEQTLPAHMVPWAYVPLAALPLTGSGKLDRRALPSPEESAVPREIVAPRDDVEERILAIWTQVIGVKNIGVTDRFNEVGGNSFAAVRVFSRIAEEFAQKLQLVTILKHDTIEQLANLLRAPTQHDTWECIVPLATTGTGVPIFCAHAAAGNVLIYQHFAKEVGAHHPVYGIQAYGNWGTQVPHESIEEMVDFYVQEILKVRPHGPYIFLGGSSGGYIALALAHAMRDLGHEVEMVVMYDTAGPGYPQYTQAGRIEKFAREHGGIPIWRLKRIFASDKESGGGRTLRTIVWNLRETMRWWYGNTRREFLYWKYEQHNPPADVPMPANLTRVRLASHRVAARHTPRYYQGRITHFRAEQQPDGAIHDPTTGWSGRSAELEIHHVPSGHTAGMSYPAVVQLAKTFLERAKASRATRQQKARSD